MDIKEFIEKRISILEREIENITPLCKKSADKSFFKGEKEAMKNEILYLQSMLKGFF